MFAQRSYNPAPAAGGLPSSVEDGMNYLATALDEISEGAIFMNSEGQLIWHNRAFDKLLVDNSEGHVLVTTVIELARDFYRDFQTAHISPAGRQMLPASVAHKSQIGGVSHEIHCTLMPKGMLGAESFLLCLVKRLASRWSSYEVHLRQTWNLTEREAQVAVHCLRGKKNLEIADHLRISVETVNKHLDKVYQKAGVRGRAELASRLLDTAL
jgi:DNA-binding CsgD family transcriptional regulator